MRGASLSTAEIFGKATGGGGGDGCGRGGGGRASSGSFSRGGTGSVSRSGGGTVSRSSSNFSRSSGSSYSRSSASSRNFDRSSLERSTSRTSSNFKRGESGLVPARDTASRTKPSGQRLANSSAQLDCYEFPQRHQWRWFFRLHQRGVLVL